MQMRFRDYLKGFVVVTSLLGMGGVGGWTAKHYDDKYQVSKLFPGVNFISGKDFEDYLPSDSRSYDSSPGIVVDIEEYSINNRNGDVFLKARTSQGNVYQCKITPIRDKPDDKPRWRLMGRVTLADRLADK